MSKELSFAERLAAMVVRRGDAARAEEADGLAVTSEPEHRAAGSRRRPRKRAAAKPASEQPDKERDEDDQSDNDG